MSVMIQLPVALSPMPVAPAPSIRVLLSKVVASVRAAFGEPSMPTYAERHAKPVDILSSSHPHGYGRDSLGWSDIGYKF